MDIVWIKSCIKENHYYYLEKYGDTGRGQSCLVAGFTLNGKPIHAVCGVE